MPASGGADLRHPHRRRCLIGKVGAGKLKSAPSPSRIIERRLPSSSLRRTRSFPRCQPPSQGKVPHWDKLLGRFKHFDASDLHPSGAVLLAAGVLGCVFVVEIIDAGTKHILEGKISGARVAGYLEGAPGGVGYVDAGIVLDAVVTSTIPEISWPERSMLKVWLSASIWTDSSTFRLSHGMLALTPDSWCQMSYSPGNRTVVTPVAGDSSSHNG